MTRSRLDRHPALPSRIFPRVRDVVVHVPAGYDDDPTRRYPVLYMHDGQNLFDPGTSFVPGQYWHLGEMADLLIDEGRVAPLLIVGVNHAVRDRIHEYTPTKDPRLGGGLGGRHRRRRRDCHGKRPNRGGQRHDDRLPVNLQYRQ